MVAMPIPVSVSASTFPTPHSRSTGSGARNPASVPGGTITRPSGFRRSEATLATNLFAASPAEAVRPVSARIRVLIRRTASSGGPKSACVPDRSTNASSTETGSTSGEKPPRIAMISPDTRWYLSMSTGK